MKKYEIVASKEVVAEFTMDHVVYDRMFGFARKAAEWIVKQHPELTGAPYDTKFDGALDGPVTVVFYSIGNLVINEK
jgi:hypothetical protein